MDPSDGPPTVEVAGARRPLRGERVCGDAWVHTTGADGRVLVALLDGLGHGEPAAVAAEVATDFIRSDLPPLTAEFDLSYLISQLDRKLRKTRGAVASIALIDPPQQLLRVVGVGNVEGYVLGRQPVRLVPRFGIIGSGSVRVIAPQVVAFPPDAMLVLHTDGIAGIALPEIPRERSCAAVAEFMLARWGRADDDSAAVVARLHSPRRAP